MYLCIEFQFQNQFFITKSEKIFRILENQIFHVSEKTFNIVLFTGKILSSSLQPRVNYHLYIYLNNYLLQTGFSKI